MALGSGVPQLHDGGVDGAQPLAEGRRQAAPHEREGLLEPIAVPPVGIADEADGLEGEAGQQARRLVRLPGPLQQVRRLAEVAGGEDAVVHVDDLLTSPCHEQSP